MDGLSVASSVVGLLGAVLKVVEIIASARDDCRAAPEMTRKLTEEIAAAEPVLKKINKAVELYPTYEHGWAELERILCKLRVALESANEEVVKHIKKDEKRRAAVQAVEVLKATFKVGAAKQKKEIEATLGDIIDCNRQLNYLVSADVFLGTLELRSMLKKSDPSSSTVPSKVQEFLTWLRRTSNKCLSSSTLADIKVEVQGRDGKWVPPVERISDSEDEDETSDTTRGRESGLARVPNSSKIRFQLSGPPGEKFFYIVLDDVYDKSSSPELFFPKNIKEQKNTFPMVIRNKYLTRTFPDSRRCKYDPNGLTLERSQEVPADQDSPWAIYIVVTKKQLAVTEGGSLTIEDIARSCVHQVDDVDSILVKKFLIDVMMREAV